MEAICSSETSVDTTDYTIVKTGFLLSLFFNPEDGGDMLLRNVGWQRTTRRYIPEDSTLQC
jgi:hypothetical protein